MLHASFYILGRKKCRMEKKYIIIVITLDITLSQPNYPNILFTRIQLWKNVQWKIHLELSFHSTLNIVTHVLTLSIKYIIIIIIDCSSSWCYIISTHLLYWFGFIGFNATFDNISVTSWLSLLLVEETGIRGEHHRPASSHWQTLSPHVLHLAVFEIRTHNISGERHCLHR